MTFDHIGIITDQKKPGETFVAATRVWITDMAEGRALRRLHALSAA